MKYLFLFCLSLCTCISASSQIVIVQPPFPTINDDITVIYDATQGNAGLVGVQQVYMHTGLITDQSAAPNDWKYVVGNWGQDDPKVKMINIGNNKHMLSFNIKTFYGVPANTIIKQLAFVFRNVDGSKEGKTSDLKDIFSPVYQPNSGLLINLVTPSETNLIVEAGDTIPILFYTSEKANITVTENKALLKSISDATVLNFDLIVSSPGTHLIFVSATTGTETAKDSFYYTINPSVEVEDLPTGTQPGINITSDNSVIFALYAPYKKYVYVIGDFNNWIPDANYYMKRTTDGNTWWVEVKNLDPNIEYAFQYYIDGELKIAEPYSEKVLDPYYDSGIPASVYPNLKAYPAGKTTGVVTVFKTKKDSYNWQNNSFTKPKKTDLVIYELLIRDFIATHSYKTLLDTLNYLQKLGVNAIELMPVNEFDGNNSWGYATNFQLALDKYYGRPEDLKAFIDACHGKGIAVIFDMVLNHACGLCPLVELYFNNATGQVLPQSPYYNVVARHPYNVCYDMNHESKATQYFVDRVLDHWIEDFHFDGYRFDLSKGITQVYSTNDAQFSAYDTSRIKLLTRIANVCWAKDPSFYVILEHFAENKEEKELSSKGMMLWGNANYSYTEASMGYTSDLSGVSYKNRGWADPNLISYMESHDEERVNYKNLNFGNTNGSYSIKTLHTALDRIGMDASFFFTIPGPKMIWMFGELGYDYSINTCEDGSINNNCRLSPKPIRWDYLNVNNRKRLNDIFTALINLKKSLPVFETTDFTIKLTGSQKSIHLNDPNMNIAVLGNFDVKTASIDPQFQHTGWWYDYFSGDSIQVSNVNQLISLEAGEYHLYSDNKLATPELNPLVGTHEVENILESSVYPNPVNDVIHIDLNLLSSDALNVFIYDLSGKILYRQDIKDLQGGEYELSIPLNSFSHRMNGNMLFVKLVSGKYAKMHKVVVK
ncbi:MAG TPA: alpha-amylase family glycosyl hydrolase [Saprospiraceae bacterium]|nr:alpha-amylase family glycosyl hydrolase [Saprospiraceae bacterium]